MLLANKALRGIPDYRFVSCTCLESRDETRIPVQGKNPSLQGKYEWYDERLSRIKFRKNILIFNLFALLFVALDGILLLVDYCDTN